MATAAASKGHLYRLVDPSISSSRRLSPQALKLVERVPNPFLAQKPSEQLYLQRVGFDEVKAQLEAELKAAPESLLSPMPFCGWLISTQTPRTVAAYLKRQISQPGPTGTRVCFRFYDPRVLAQLERVLEPNQLSALIGPIDQWIYLDIDHRLRQINPHGHKRYLGRPHFTAAQWQSIKRIGQVNQYLELYRTLPEEDKNGPASSADIDDLLIAANEYKLAGNDIGAFVLHGLVVKTDFYLHPLMQRLLRRVDEQTSYIELTDRLSDEEWDAISTRIVEESL